jgi:hypothetical protein
MAAAETVTGRRTKSAGPSARTLSRVPAANRSLTAPPPRSPAQARASTPSRAWPGTCSRTNGSALAAYNGLLHPGRVRAPRCSRTTSTCSRPRHVAVIVLQVPTGLIGKGWCTAGPPSRCPGTPGDAGRPLRAAASHPPVHAGGTDARGLQRTRPWAYNDRFTAQIADAAREITRRAGTPANPANYAQRFPASSAR